MAAKASEGSLYFSKLVFDHVLSPVVVPALVPTVALLGYLQCSGFEAEGNLVIYM